MGSDLTYTADSDVAGTERLPVDGEPNPYVQFLENWMPGIGECTELHDYLHVHFGLDFSVRSEAILLGFQLGHHAAGNFFHVVVFALMSLTIYPADYRNGWGDIRAFYEAYLLGKEWQSVGYWFVPPGLLRIVSGA